jgi:hypothetical protein
MPERCNFFLWCLDEGRLDDFARGCTLLIWNANLDLGMVVVEIADVKRVGVLAKQIAVEVVGMRIDPVVVVAAAALVITFAIQNGLFVGKILFRVGEMRPVFRSD